MNSVPQLESISLLKLQFLSFQFSKASRLFKAFSPSSLYPIFFCTCKVKLITELVFLFSGVTVTLCLLSNVWKLLLHIFCPVFSLFIRDVNLGRYYSIMDRKRNPLSLFMIYWNRRKNVGVCVCYHLLLGKESLFTKHKIKCLIWVAKLYLKKQIKTSSVRWVSNAVQVKGRHLNLLISWNVFSLQMLRVTEIRKWILN